MKCAICEELATKHIDGLPMCDDCIRDNFADEEIYITDPGSSGIIENLIESDIGIQDETD